MAVLALDVASRLQTPGYRDAKAIQTGYQWAAVPDADAAEDEAFTGRDDEAGYRWAERRSLNRPEACPDYSAAFRQGCEAYAREQVR
jgi:hypothetical protein